MSVWKLNFSNTQIFYLDLIDNLTQATFIKTDTYKVIFSKKNNNSFRNKN